MLPNLLFTEKNRLDDLTWMHRFVTRKNGLILVKSALFKGNKIGAFNPFGHVVWIDRDAIVFTEKLPTP